MGKSNIAVKQWLRDKERFADLFNGQIFGGRQIILPEELEMLDSDTGVMVPGNNGKLEATERRRDIYMRWKQGADLVLLGCENQDKIHYAMPIRNMLYDSLQYSEQVKNIKKQNLENKSVFLTGDEFLSGIKMDDKISPVITLVFYYGEKPWNAAVRLHELFPKDMIGADVLEKYVPDYKINLIDAGNIQQIERYRTDLQQIFGMLKCRGNKEALVDYIRKNNQYFSNVDEDTYHVIGEFLHSERIMKKEINTGKGKEEIDMCKALEDLYNDGVNEGIERGEEKMLLQQIQKKLAKGKSVEEIADDLEQEVRTIEGLIEKL